MKSQKRIKRIFGGFISLCLIVAASHTVNARSFELVAVSSDPGPKLKVVLIWPEVHNVSGYSIFRKNKGELLYHKKPINTMPIRRLTKCYDITSVLGSGSFEWTLIQNALADSSGLFDPCGIDTLYAATGHTRRDSIIRRKYDMLMLLARGNYKIAKVMGLAFEDTAVTQGKEYIYKIVSIKRIGEEISVLDSDVIVTAGKYIPLPAPTGVVAEGGDNRVQIRWSNRSYATGFKITRALIPAGLFKQVNPSTYVTKVTNKLNGDTLVPNPFGFLDFQRYDSVGMPTTHVVRGVNISGPSNSTTYYYKVAANDLLGRTGIFSPVVSATPGDSTPPMTPVGLTVTPDEINSCFHIQWQRVKLDVLGHVEIPGVKSYSLYRYESVADPKVGAQLVSETIFPDPNPDILTISYTDASPALRVNYVDKTWYYRVVSKDNSNNFSDYSSAISGIMKDTTRPALVKNVTTIGEEASISLKWQPNEEPDIYGYMIYRGYCDFGHWAECPKKTNVTHWTQNQNCDDGFVFLGQVDQDKAKTAFATDKWAYTDSTVPPGSPLCYAYWVKAVDKSGNISGSYPRPVSNAEKASIVCQRLRDKTPPEPAIISGLSARDRGVFVEWMGPPTQDIHSYYIYRAKEKETEPYEFLAQVTVAFPPNVPQIIYTKFTPNIIDVCDSVAYAINKYMSFGSFLDIKADPKQIYWYKVTGVDQNGNESDISKAAGISTFAYTTQLAHAPVINSIETTASPCGLLLKWNPVFNSSVHKGFVIFKSVTETGQYFQATQPIADNKYTDTNVVNGTEYWYRIAILDAKGMLSKLSNPMKGKINP